MAIEQLAQFQQVIHAERRTTGRNLSEYVHWKHVRNIDREGLQPAVRIIEEDAVHSPVVVPVDELILIPSQRMKRMRDAEPTG